MLLASQSTRITSLIRLKLCEYVLNDDIKRKDRTRLRRGKRTTLTGHPSMHHAGAWSHRVPFTQDETRSKNLTSTQESILKVRVKPRSLYRGLYFSKKNPKPTSLQSHSGSRERTAGCAAQGDTSQGAWTLERQTEKLDFTSAQEPQG